MTLNELVPAIIALAGTVFGALIAGLVQHFSVKTTHERELSQKRKSLAYSIAGEIESVISAAKRRQWIQDLEGHVALLRGDVDEVKEEMRLIKKEATMHQSGFEHLVSAYSRKADELGLLGEVSGEVVAFYNGVLLSKGLFDTIGQVQFLEETEPSHLADVLEKEARILHEVLLHGRETADKLRASF